jgi:hypothetical protein
MRTMADLLRSSYSLFKSEFMDDPFSSRGEEDGFLRPKRLVMSSKERLAKNAILSNIDPNLVPETLSMIELSSLL